MNRLILLSLVVAAGCTNDPLGVRTWDVRPALPPAAEQAVGHSLRVEPFSARGGREGREVVTRLPSRELVYDPSRQWARRPADLATDGVVAALRAVDAFTSVGAAGEGGGDHDITIRGELLAFDETADAAEVELAATLIPAEGRLRPAAPIRLEAVGRVEFRGDEPDDRAKAMEEALGLAMARLAESAVAAASSFKPKLAVESRTVEVARVDLVVEPARVSPLSDRRLAVHVGRVDAPPGLDRSELRVRRAAHRVSARAAFEWTKRPSEVVSDALADAFRAALGANGRVLRTHRSSGVEVEVTGRIRRFELDATVEPAVARVDLEVTLNGRSALLTGSRVPTADDPDAIASAFAAAIAEVVAQAPALVPTAPLDAPAPGSTEMVEVFLALDPPMPSAGGAGGEGSIGISRLQGVGGVDRLEVMRREGAHVVRADRELRWQRRPASMVTDGLVLAFDSCGAFPGGVYGPGSPGTPSLRISGSLETFELADREGTRTAEVSLRLTLREGDRIARLEVSGSAPVRGDAPHDVAQAMSAALGEAFAASVERVVAHGAEGG